MGELGLSFRQDHEERDRGFSQGNGIDIEEAVVKLEDGAPR